MRSTAGIPMVLLTACGGGVQVSSSDAASAAASVTAETSVNAAPSASPPRDAGELRAWPSGDCAFADDLAAFLDFAVAHYVVDPARVYLSGISCGAIGIWDYLAGYGGEAVAAAVPIAGHAEWALQEAGCAPLTEVPVWAFHGAVDETVPVVYIQGPMDQIRACDGTEPPEMELTVYPDADHDAWTRTYDLSAGNDIYAWMLQHTIQSAE